MRTIIPILALMLFSACGKKAAKDTHDWSERSLTPTTLKLTQGTKQVSVSVALPSGVVADTTRSNAWRKSYIADKKDYFSDPTVTISLLPRALPDLNAAIANAFIGDKMVIAKSTTLPTGHFLFVYHTKKRGLLYVKSYLNHDGMVVECRASQAKQGGVPSFSASVAWLERLCSSTRVQ